MRVLLCTYAPKTHRPRWWPVMPSALTGMIPPNAQSVNCVSTRMDLVAPMVQTSVTGCSLWVSCSFSVGDLRLGVIYLRSKFDSGMSGINAAYLSSMVHAVVTRPRMHRANEKGFETGRICNQHTRIQAKDSIGRFCTTLHFCFGAYGQDVNTSSTK